MTANIDLRGILKPSQPGTLDYALLAQAHVADLYPTIIYSKPRLMDMPPGTIIGTWHYSIPGQCRFILDREEEVITGVLPGDLARAWVRDVWKLPIKRRKSQLSTGFVVPLHARVGSWGDCQYIDINHAYLYVLALGFDLEYELESYIGANPVPVPAQVASNKRAYATAVTMSGNTRSDFEVMGKQGLYNRRPINIFSNPCLYALAHDVLNGVGSEMLAVLGDHIVYINTDGFVVKSHFAPYAQDIISSWGLQWSIKYEGLTEIRGVGSYRIGDFTTRRFDPGAEDFTGDLMNRDQRRWLKSRWVRWAARIQPTLPAKERVER
jgi:hypothetical protein